MKITASVMFLSLLLASSCGVERLKVAAGPSSTEKKFETTLFSTRRALSRGEIKEALTSYEFQAKESERKATTSPSRQSYWRDAILAHSEGFRAARLSGQAQKAIAYSQRAVELAQKTTNRELLLRASEQLILAYMSVNDFDGARDLIKKGLEIVKEMPPKSYTRIVWEAKLYDNLGRDFLNRGDYASAIDAFGNSVFLTRQRLDRLARRKGTGREASIETTRISALQRITHLGDAHRQAGKFQEALEQYRLVLKLIKAWKNKYPYEPGLYTEMAELYFRQKDFAQALTNFKLALATRETRGQLDGNLNVRISRRIGDVYLQTGDPFQAIAYYGQAIQHVESLRSVLASEEHRRSFFEGQLHAYASIIAALTQLGHPGEAFNYSERARSRVFLDVLGSRVQLSRARSGLFEEERSLQERIASIKASLSGEEDGEIDRLVLRKQLAQAEQAYTAFLGRVRKQNKEQASLMSVEPLVLKEVQELLDPGTTLVEYFVTEQEVFAWVVEKENLQFRRVDLPKEKLSSLVKTLRESIFALGEREKFSETSSMLFNQLIQPLLSDISGKELIIVPHDVLHYLPFHALQSGDGKYLIEKYPVYYLSSASLLQFVKEKRRAKGDNILAFGNPDLGDPEKNLEFAELEAQEVKRVYPSSTVFVKKDATEEKSKSFSLQHDILHFATHAELNENEPLSSAVLLAKGGKEDGRLEVREIFSMDLKANLVVLSGCETGLGKLSTGDELVGLTRAFIYAGTPSVVASLWTVDDSSTAHLMGSFYRNLKTMSKVEALRQAQLDMIRGKGSSDVLVRRGVGGIGKLGDAPSSPSQHPISVPSSSVSTSHPYFWAPFVLIGDGQ